MMHRAQDAKSKAWISEIHALSCFEKLLTPMQSHDSNVGNYLAALNGLHDSEKFI
jgi:hypothetical protein